MIIRDQCKLNLPVAKCISYDEIKELEQRGELSDLRNIVRPSFDKGFTVIDLDNRKIYIVFKNKPEDRVSILNLKQALNSLKWYMLLYDVGDIIIDTSNIKYIYIRILNIILDNFDYNFYFREGDNDVDTLYPNPN